MFCKYCGEKIDDDSKFCSKCGARLARQEADAAVDKAASGASDVNAATTQADAASVAGETASVETAASEAETAAEIEETTEATEKAETTDAVPVQSDAVPSAASDDKQWNISPKSGKTALLLAIFGGVFGLHRFYLGNVWGIFSTFIVWVIGISAGSEEYVFFILAIFLWAIIDVILLATGHYKDYNGRVVLLSIEKYLTARTLEDGSGVEIYAFDVPPQNRCGITPSISLRVSGECR